MLDIATKVYDSIREFFFTNCGEGNSPGIENSNTNLLRIACVGNPERTIQGELFFFLKSRHLHVISEYRYQRFDDSDIRRRKSGRSIDIMILDDDFQPACMIELKHFSRVQGNVKGLLSGLQADEARLLTSCIPLIQVGLYTDLSSIPNVSREQLQAYRFITYYALKPNKVYKGPEPECDATVVEGFHALVEWANRACELNSVISFSGIPNQFETPVGVVSGRVHYFIGLRLPKSGHKTEPCNL